jgi:hypothetical protein
MRKSFKRIKSERISASRAAAGRISQVVQAERRMDDSRNVYQLARVIEIKRADGSVAATWRVFATGNPLAPLAVDFGGELHRYMSVRRLSPLIARKMFEVVG